MSTPSAVRTLCVALTVTIAVAVARRSRHSQGRAAFGVDDTPPTAPSFRVRRGGSPRQRHVDTTVDIAGNENCLDLDGLLAAADTLGPVGSVKTTVSGDRNTLALGTPPCAEREAGPLGKC